MDELLQAMTYSYPKRIPVSFSILPAAWLHYGKELKRLTDEFPDIVTNTPDLAHIEDSLPATYHKGTFVDEWGCVWENLTEGMEAIVTGHPVPHREDIRSLKIPENRDGRLPHGFMYLRLLDLRGFEESMMDFAEECEELDILIEKVLTYNCYQIEAALPKAGKIMFFGDDLGIQTGLAIGPQKWRKYLKPAFTKMYSIVKATGRYVYMHTDGMIYEIMPDLQECGVDMINPQFRANGLENLARVCKGKIPINLDLDRQLFPFATPAQLDDHVREAVETLYLPEGGLGLSFEIGKEVPLENVAALLNAARKYREYKK